MEELNIADDSLLMLKLFPLLLPSNNFKHWEGIVDINGTEVVMNIDVPNYPLIKQSTVKCTPGFQLIMNEAVEKAKENANSRLYDIITAVQKSNTVPSYCHQFSTNNAVNDVFKDCVSLVDRYNRVMKELNSIGTNVFRIDDSFACLSLRNVDDSGYEHVLELMLPNNYPTRKPILKQVDLPDIVIPQLTSCNTITEIFTKFCSIITSLQEFWQVYDNLRRNAWVIDPENPTKKDTYCRIVVTNSVSILVTLNPLEVMTFPEIKFLGADRAVMPLRRQLEDNLKEFGWDMNLDLIENLLRLFSLVEFPEPPTLSNSQQARDSVKDEGLLVTDQECSICFTLRTDDNMLPTKICNNDNCNTVFHISCLAQWFQSVPTNEPSFNLISGDCPQCGKRILCPLSILD